MVGTNRKEGKPKIADLLNKKANKKEEEDIAGKRRRKREEEEMEEAQRALPQKKRTLMVSPSRSPARKTVKQEEQDDETLIRETEAALKSLSGSWPARDNNYREQEESPAFENLFEEKKKICLEGGIKDIITLRATQKTDINKNPIVKEEPGEERKSSEGDTDSSYMKMESDCNSLQSNVSKVKQEGKYSRYEPDFNELVDDSSNELEIDMSDPSAEEERKKKEEKEDKKFVSAFKPIEKEKIGLDMLGPYPAGATFVGYPGLPPPPQRVEEKRVIKEEVVTTESVSSSKRTDSPGSKQYTILQPAGAGSRAASVVQDVAREGVVSVPAVSSSVSPPKGDRPLSPNSIGKGTYCL